jgi:hypothetical protein
VNHNVASRRKSLQRGALTILRVGIGEVQGEMKPAFRVSAIHDVNSFGRLVISCTHFWADRIPANRYRVRAQFFAMSKKNQSVL